MPDEIQKDTTRLSKGNKKTVIENVYELGKIPGIDVAFIISQNRQCTTYESVKGAGFPLSKEQIVR